MTPPRWRRYAKQAVDQQFARWVMLHMQSNPPLCTQPRVLIKGKRTPDDGVRGGGGRDVRAFGVDASHTPAADDAVPRVIARRPDTVVGFGETRIHAETATFEVGASEVASPRPGDQLIIDGQTFVIQGAPERRDPERLVWTLDVRPS